MKSTVTPGNKSHLSKEGTGLANSVRAMAAEYKISERTARRYLKRGIDPSECTYRRTGKDGKAYHVPYRPDKSPLHKPLSIARSNIRRAARAEEFIDADLHLLREIETEAIVLISRWEGAL